MNTVETNGNGTAAVTNGKINGASNGCSNGNGTVSNAAKEVDM